MSNDLTKKEYLKKYLSSGSDKKKKKKKVATTSVTKSRIVDDDIDLKNMKPVSDSELEIFDLAEEAPQIVGIIDDRPEEIRIMSEFRSTKKWKIVADEYGVEDITISAIDKNKRSESESPPRKSKDEKESRKKQKHSDSDYSPPMKSKNDDSDASPPRRDRKKNEGNSRKSRNDDSDASPPRKNKRKDEGTADRKIKKRNDDSDASPPRKTIKKEIDSDASPPRRKTKNKDDSDASPPRRRNKEKDDSDASPPRRKSNSRFSDSRKRFDKSDSRDRGRDFNRRRNVEKVVKKKQSSSSSSDSDSDSSSDRKGKGKKANQDKGGKASKNSEEPKADGVKKTLSGKKAGLQDSKELRKESEEFRKKQSELFSKMSDEVSGRNATAIVRDRKTGRKRDFKEEARKKREKEEKEAERLAQYAVWGKGVKQVEERHEKIKEDLYEMSKPLARYAGDKDLDEMLKNQEWEGDPMLEYIRKKKKAKSEKSGAKSRPEYQGIFLPNRYGIKPGHRWDGVDRSNGYEKRWFEEQNAKKAREEEAFKWSTADM